MTGPREKTLSKLQDIHKGIEQGMTASAVAVKLNITRSAVSDFIKRYSPKLRKKNRLLPKSKFNKQTDLQRAQHERFCRKRVNARQTGYEWDLKFEDIKWPTHCPCFGTELDYFASNRQENSPSFDRIDPNKGYVRGNVQIISWRANRIKNNGTAEEHLQIAEFMSTLTLFVK